MSAQKKQMNIPMKFDKKKKTVVYRPRDSYKTSKRIPKILHTFLQALWKKASTRLSPLLYNHFNPSAGSWKMYRPTRQYEIASYTCYNKGTNFTHALDFEAR